MPAHLPVLRDRVVELLAPALERPGAVLVDATVGLGGHAEAVLTACGVVRVIGVDRDAAALEAAGERLRDFGERFVAVHAVYDQIPEIVDRLGVGQIDGLLFDLGVSSLQLDEVGRGFAYRTDAPLDMRMDPTGGLTAADIVNTYSVDELARVLRDYGEERLARRIAAAIVSARTKQPFRGSAQLVELLYAVIPAPARRRGGHPAKRTFQALRIEVNDELGTLRRALPAALSRLSVGGRIVVEAYHSLEDRVVKQVLADLTSPRVPRDLPVVPEDRQPAFRLLTRGAEKPVDAEVVANPRAASVRLRAAVRERLDPVSGAA